MEWVTTVVKTICGIITYFYNWWQGRKYCVYLGRTIDWKTYNLKTHEKYLVCGTTLRELAEEDIIGQVFQNALNGFDIRIILPATTPGSLACQQLQSFDKITNGGPIDEQVSAAKNSFEKIAGRLEKYVKVADHLKKYDAIMYHNITIYDNDAFISFYDPAGVGNRNITLHFRGRDSDGYQHVKELFEKIWEVSS